MNLQRLFVEHPHSIGETYLEHQRCALEFGVTLLSAGLACLLHALIPALFRETASRTVAELHERLRARK